MLSDHEQRLWLADLLENILAAGLDPSRWGAVPGLIAEAWPGTAVSLQGADHTTIQCIGVLHKGMRQDMAESYEHHFSRINPWTAFWATMPTMRAFNSDDSMPASSFERTEFYNDFIKRHGGIESASGIKVLDDTSRFAWIAIHYDVKLASSYKVLMPRILEQIAPAIRASMSLHREFALKSVESATSDVLLDALNCPALVLDGDGVVKGVNALAEVAACRAHIFKLRNGRFIPRDAAVGIELKRVLHSIKIGVVEDKHILLKSPEGVALGVMSILPISPIVSSEIDRLFAPERRVLVILREFAMVIPVSARLLQELYGLTNAETRLAEKLASGQSLVEISNVTRVSKETVRVHLRNLFDKTGTHRQAQLVSLVARVAAAQRQAN